MGWHSIFDFEVWIYFIFLFFYTWHPPRNGSQLVRLAEPCTNNRPFANERRSCWPIACIYFMKNLLLWARLPHIYIWNNELKCAKDMTCERNLYYHKTECDACIYFLSTFPRCEAKVLDQRAEAIVVQTRCADVKPLWEREREKTQYSWITHTAFKWLI